MKSNSIVVMHSSRDEREEIMSSESKFGGRKR